MRNEILFLFALYLFFVAMPSIVSALEMSSPSNIYLEANVTYPLILVPLDENVYNVTLNVFENGNWTQLNFTWTGEQYELSILFTALGDFPFVVNSTEVEGELTGNFLVRNSFYVTYRFYRDKRSFPFLSNKYINEMSYVTAELTGESSMFANNYDPILEPYFAPLRIRDDRFQKSVWYAPYRNGVATLKLYETDEEYAIRLIDGDILFTSEYSVPNYTESYGVNAYIGKYTFDGTNQTYDILLTSKDLHPYRWLINWILIASLICVVAVSIGLFFMIPEVPMLSIIFGIGFSVLFLIIRVVLFLWRGV